MRRRQRQHGFTLFELLVAVAILAIISAMAYSGLIQVEDARKQLTDTETRLSEIQLAFLNFERDIQQVVHRPIRNQYDTLRPSVAGQGEYLMELTRGGVRNPAHVARSLLQRVAYMVENDNLERLSWSVLDQAPDSQPAKQVLLKKITSIEIRFLDSSGEWSTYWPPQTTSSTATTALPPDAFPRAVSVKLELPDVGSIERIFLVPEA
ncbi:MAG: type II secretion system protein GspJ [Gammaproteobacteria bacterium]|nr:type II secretion system protein GspJ [Gammaproteobacteria bacterium]